MQAVGELGVTQRKHRHGRIVGLQVGL
jgi:hypothetical protein